MKTLQDYNNMTVEEIMAECKKEYEESHTAKIKLEYGNTYVSFGEMDYVTTKNMQKINTLLDLMGIEYWVGYPFKEGNSFYVMFKGEDPERADFIRRFIDNGYKLSWK